MQDDGFDIADYFLTRRDVHRTVGDATPHIEPDALEVIERTPIAAGIAVYVRIIEVLEVLGPNQFRTVPHSTAVYASLFHNGTDTG